MSALSTIENLLTAHAAGALHARRAAMNAAPFRADLAGRLLCISTEAVATLWREPGGLEMLRKSTDNAWRAESDRGAQQPRHWAYSADREVALWDLMNRIEHEIAQRGKREAA